MDRLHHYDYLVPRDVRLLFASEPEGTATVSTA